MRGSEHRRATGARAAVLAWCALGVIYVWLLTPIGLIVLLGLSGDLGSGGTPIEQVFTEPSWRKSLGTSLGISSAATILGGGAAVVLTVGFRLGSCLQSRVVGVIALVFSPLLVPHVVLGIGYSRVLDALSVEGNRMVLALSHSIFTLPLVLAGILVSIRKVPAEVLEVALSLGASWGAAIRRILLPAIWPGAVAGGTIAFLYSFDELMLTQFIAEPSVIPVSVRLWSGLRYYVDPTVFGVGAATLLLGIAGLSMALRRMD